MRSSIRSMITVTAALLASAVPGAVANVAQAAPPEPPAESRATPTANAHGMVEMISEALSAVTVNPDQEASIEKLGERLDPLQDQLDKAESNLLLAIAEQVKTGTIDRAALEPEIASYAAARETLARPLHAALEDLHEMLDKQQRTDFADALECSVYDVTRTILSRDTLVAFEEKLDLDPVQTQDVKDAFQDVVTMLQIERRDVHEAIEAFRTNYFTLEAFFPLEQVRAKAERRADRMIDVTEAILNLLDRDQVDKLAAAITESAEAKAGTPTANEAQKEDAIEAHAWVAGRVRGFRPVARPVFVGGAARGYRMRVMPFPVAGIYGWGM
jgi:hypothetical protein